MVFQYLRAPCVLPDPSNRDEEQKQEMLDKPCLQNMCFFPGIKIKNHIGILRNIDI